MKEIEINALEHVPQNIREFCKMADEIDNAVKVFVGFGRYTDGQSNLCQRTKIIIHMHYHDGLPHVKKMIGDAIDIGFTWVAGAYSDELIYEHECRLQPTIDDLTLIKVAWQLSLTYSDEDFDQSAIQAQLKAHDIDPDDIAGLVNRMLELDLLDVTEIGSLYRCSRGMSSSTLIELLIVPDVPDLHDAVLVAVKTAVEQFGSLVEIEAYSGE